MNWVLVIQKLRDRADIAYGTARRIEQSRSDGSLHQLEYRLITNLADALEDGLLTKEGK